MDVSDVLRSAAVAVDEASLAPEFRAIGFSKAVELLSSHDGVAPVADASAGMAPGAQADLGGLSRVAARLGIDVETVADVFDDTGDDLQVIVAPSKLPANRSGATKTLALLVAAGRQAAGYDEGWTTASAIREVCRDYGKLDGPNFSTALGAMKHDFSFRGKGAQREVKVTRPGFDSAGRLVRQLATGGGE